VFFSEIQMMDMSRNPVIVNEEYETTMRKPTQEMKLDC
jgi:hypothetical protein